MHFLRPLVTFPRVVRHYSWVGADLPLDEDVLLDAPGYRVRAVLPAAAEGDFRPARELLAGAGRAAEWERRDTYVAELATAALDDDGWLRRWREYDPESGDAAVVEAERQLRAWRAEEFGARRRRFEGWGVRRRGGPGGAAGPGPRPGADAGPGAGHGTPGPWAGMADAESWPWYGVPGAGPGYGRPGTARPGPGRGSAPGAGGGTGLPDGFGRGAGPGAGAGAGTGAQAGEGPDSGAGSEGSAPGGGRDPRNGAARGGGGRRPRGAYGAGGPSGTDARALLRDVLPLVRLAAAQAPGDPVPWRIALDHATAVRAPREAFVSRFAEAVLRAPGHHGAHVAALRYLAIVGGADVEELIVFAEESAEEALPGSLLHGLPLEAAVLGACRERVGLPGGPDAGDAPDSSTTWAVERALELSAHYEPGDAEAAGFRNCLAAALVRARRWDEALEVFRAVGSDARAVPWAQPGDDAEAVRRRFLLARQEVRAELARRVPLFGSRPDNAPGPGAAFGLPGTGVGGAPVPDPYAGIVVCTAPPAVVAKAAHTAGLGLRLAAAGGARTCAQLRRRQRPGPAGTPVRAPGRAPSRWPRGRTAAGEPPAPEALLAAAEAMTRGEAWPAVALYAADGAAGIAVYRGGERTAEFTWRASGAASVTATVRGVAPSPSPGGANGAASGGGPAAGGSAGGPASGGPAGGPAGGGPSVGGGGAVGGADAAGRRDAGRAPGGGTGRVAQFAEVRNAAEAIAAALAVADARPLTGVLRTAGTRRPRSTLVEALQSMGLPELAPVFEATSADPDNPPPSRPAPPRPGPLP